MLLRSLIKQIIILILLSVLLIAQLNYEPNLKSIHREELEFYRNFPSEPDTSFTLDLIPALRKDITAELSHEVFGYLPYWKYSSYGVLNYNLLTTIAYFSAEVSSTGSITNVHNWPASSLVSKAHQNGVRVVLVATLFDRDGLSTLLGSAGNRTRCVNNLLNEVLRGNGDGVNIDFEGVPSSQRTNLVKFMQELADSFRTHIADAHISMASPAVDWSSAWDYKALANICDALFIMGYNYHWSGSSTTGPVAPLTGYNYDIEWTVNDYLGKTNQNSDKIILGLPYYGIEWPTVSSSTGASTSGSGSSKFYATAESNAQYYGKLWHSASQTPWYRYQSGGWYQCWYDDSLSLALKYEYAKTKNLQGVGMWALAYDGSRPELWGALADAFSGSGSVIPPAQPEGLVVRNLGNGDIEVHVDPVIDAQEFAFYISENGTDFSLYRQDNANEIVLYGPEPDQIYYFKVKAINDAGESSFTEVGAAIPTITELSILIVNGFDRTSGTANTFDFVRQHGNAIAQTRNAFDFASNEAIIKGTVDLGNYKMVDWILGEEGTSTGSFDTFEQNLVIEYLENGGKLFVSGAEIGYDLMGSTASMEDKEFFQTYLKADYIKDSVSSYRVQAKEMSIFAGVEPIRFDDGTHGTYNVDYPDGIKPLNGAEVALYYYGKNYDTEGCAGITYKGSFGEGSKDGKLVYFGFPFETVYPDSTRNLLMNRIITFFDLSFAAETSRVVADRFKILRNYPNPGRPYTTFPMQLDSSNTSPKINIRIFNLLGQEVYKEDISIILENPQLFTWNGYTKNGGLAPTGVYFIRATHGRQSDRRKFSVIH